MTGGRAQILALRGIRKSFGGVLALDGVDLALQEGDVVCLIGASGCGKSTLLRCANLLVEPDAGSIVLDGREINGSPSRDRFRSLLSARELDRMRARMGMVFQQFNLWPHLTAIENVALSPHRVLGLPPAEATARARTLLDRVGLRDKIHAFPAYLSGGQQQRVAIARALAMDPRIVLFDEPTSALDPELVMEVLAVMRDVATSGMTMLIVTHELNFARQVADRVAFMDRGVIVEEGPAEEIIAAPRSERLRSFLAHVAT